MKTRKTNKSAADGRTPLQRELIAMLSADDCDMIRHRIYMYFKAGADISDWVGDIYLYIVTKIDRNLYRERGYFRTWVGCVISNYMISNLFRKRRSLYPLIDGDEDSRLAAEAPGELSAEEQEAKLMCVLRVLEGLPEDQRMLIEMKYMRKLTYTAISELTGIGRSTVEMRVQAIFRRMKKELARYGYYDAVL